MLPIFSDHFGCNGIDMKSVKTTFRLIGYIDDDLWELLNKIIHPDTHNQVFTGIIEPANVVESIWYDIIEQICMILR